MDPVRVLVVDDEEDFATAIAERLKRRGLKAAAAFGGQEALDSLSKNIFDAVVLDLKMPGMDGLETLRAIRHMDPDVQVVVLTGHGTVSSGIEGMQLGAADFLQKPVTIETLCASIEAAAERTRTARSSRSKRTEK